MKTCTNKIIFLLLFVSTSVFSQKKNKEDIAAKAYVEKERILIRWVPANKETFDLGKKYGYTIERIVTGKNFLPGDTLQFLKAIKLNAQPIKPLAENEKFWLTLLEIEPNTAIVYNALYKKNNSKAANDSLRQNAEEANFGLVLLSCDLSIELAKATGFYIEDKNIDNTSTYAYRITINAPANLKYKPCVYLVNSKKLSDLKKISDLKSSPGKNITKLTWNVSENMSDYTGYIFERSTDSVGFVRTNKTPYVHITTEYNRGLKNGVYSDSLPQNGIVYFYRVRGISHFGVLGPPSNIIRCMGKSGFKTYPYVDSVITIKNKTIDVFFHLPDYDLNKLKGFQITRANKIDGKYETLHKGLLPSNTTVFKDETPLKANYYKITAINNENDSASSHPGLGQLADEEPPQIPTGLTGKIDSLGRVTLSWNKNTESDLKGYRIYKMNTLNEEPVEVVSKYISTNAFTDTLPLSTLTEDIYYTINAVDNSYNNSKHATAIKLKKPDRIAPVKAIITKLYHSDTTIYLKWINSTSNDVVKTEIFRTENNQKIKLIEFCRPDTSTSFTDYNIKNGTVYSYELVVSDDDNNQSKTLSNAVNFETGVRPKIKAVDFSVDLDKKQIEIKWYYPEKDLYNFVVYKSKGSLPYVTYKTLKPTQLSFIDKDLAVSNIYKYKIKAVFSSGAESIISDEILVKY